MTADDLDLDIRRASILSALDASHELGACAELGEELRLLATILVSRADEAAGFHLPGSNWQLTGTLLGSLLDDQGAQAEMSAPLALHVLMEQGRHVAVDGANPATTDDPFDALVFTIGDLEALVDDPRSSPELAAAARFLAAHPDLVATTRAWEGTGAILPSHHAGEIPLRDIRAFIARNDLLRRITGPNGAISPDDLHATIDDTTLETFGIDPDQFIALALPRNGHDLLLEAIHHGTFDHSPVLARSFIEGLPVHHVDGQNIDIFAVDTDAVQRLYEAATADLSDSLGDFITRCNVVAHLPESTSGVRNALITSAYADIAHWHNVQVNGTTSPTEPEFGGNNWFHLGVAASASVGPVIRGEQRALEIMGHPIFDVPDAVEQDIADGNQAIFHHFTSEQGRYWQGEPMASAQMQTALSLLDEAATTVDPTEKQYLVAESTVLFAIEEQVVVDQYLQLGGAGIIERLGTRVLTHLLGHQRSVEQVMTDEGTLRVHIDLNDLIPPVGIGAAVPAPTHQHGNHLVDPESLAERLPTDFDWGATIADDWSELDQRLPIIEDVAILTLTEPALPAMAEHHRGGDLDPFR